jgi:hypothetical protein
MIYCDLCKKGIEGGSYENSFADILCEECSRKIGREEIYVVYCDLCKKGIEGGYYESSYADILCEECGEDLLVWNYNLDSFVLEADDKEYYFDDELSDITTYRFVK